MAGEGREWPERSEARTNASAGGGRDPGAGACGSCARTEHLRLDGGGVVGPRNEHDLARLRARLGGDGDIEDAVPAPGLRELLAEILKAFVRPALVFDLDELLVVADLVDDVLVRAADLHHFVLCDCARTREEGDYARANMGA